MKKLDYLATVLLWGCLGMITIEVVGFQLFGLFGDASVWWIVGPMFGLVFGLMVSVRGARRSRGKAVRGARRSRREAGAGESRGD